MRKWLLLFVGAFALLAEAFLFFSVEEVSAADVEDEQIGRFMKLECTYAKHKTFESERTRISSAEDGEMPRSSGQTSMFKQFKGSEGAKQKETFHVIAGQSAECIYPSGHRVRIKVGEGRAFPYGECGGDPDAFFSLWVDQRKVESREWLAGRCQRAPVVSYEISERSIKKCHWAEAAVSDQNTASQGKRLSVCLKFPDIIYFPRDYVEYPLAGKKLPAVGEIEVVRGTQSVCKAVQNELKNDWNTFEYQDPEAKLSLWRPTWEEPSEELPKELFGARESSFDFDNDGKIDRIFSREFMMHYMDGSVLLVQSGRSSTALEVPQLISDESTWFIPCQLDTRKIAMQECPLFSQKFDEAGFGVQGRNPKEKIWFRARYSTVTPFRFGNSTFIAVGSKSVATEEFIAVVKPLPGRKYEVPCLLRRVPENF